MTKEQLQRAMTAAEDAMGLAKKLIRDNNPMKHQFDPDENDCIIGYGRDLDKLPLDPSELSELMRHGLTYPFTDSIKVTYAEFLLDRQIVKATHIAIDFVGASTSQHLSVKRQQFLIHIADDLSYPRLLKLKRFVKYLQNGVYELATSELHGYDHPMGIRALMGG